MSIKRNLYLGLGLLALLALVPIIDSSRYFLGQMILFFIWVGVVTQWNLVFGVAGIFSLAQMLVFAVGGYTAAMLTFHLGWPIWITMPIGGLSSVVAGAIVGLATLRLRGAYVALLTLALATAAQTLIVVDTSCVSFDDGICVTLTGGASGLSRFADFGFRDWLGYSYATLGNFYLGLVLAAMGSLFALIVISSPLGHAFQALRDNPVCAAARGIDRIKYQLLVFSSSAFFTGILGGFYAGNFRSIGPTVLDTSTLLFLLSSMIVGGVGRIWGPILGCATLMVFDEFIKDFAEWRMVSIGIFTVLCVLVFPSGIVGLIEQVTERWRPARQVLDS
jgi:branched-chain amino acid transport system permease protein